MRNDFLPEVSSIVHAGVSLTDCSSVGWLSTTQIPKDVNAGFQPTFDQNGNGAGDAGIKARMVELISAVRTLMRSTCLSSTNLS